MEEHKNFCNEVIELGFAGSGYLKWFVTESGRADILLFQFSEFHQMKHVVMVLM